MKKSFIFTAIFAASAIISNAGEIIRPQLVCGGEAQHFRTTFNHLYLFNRKPQESTIVKVDCDKNNLYFTFDMEDNDTITEATQNQIKLANFGDAVQIFLKSEKETYLWEFFIAPNGKKSCFFHYGAGRMFYPEPDSEFPDFKVKNTLSKGKWLAEVTIPLSIFREKGFKFSSEEKWTFMLVRKNASRYLGDRDNSSFPQSGGGISDPKYFGELVLK